MLLPTAREIDRVVENTPLLDPEAPGDFKDLSDLVDATERLSKFIEGLADAMVDEDAIDRMVVNASRKVPGPLSADDPDFRLAARSIHSQCALRAAVLMGMYIGFNTRQAAAST